MPRMWWTELAKESWDALFEPHRRQSPVLRAIELLDEIEDDPAAAWEKAQEVRLPGVTRSVRRTLIEIGAPSLWIYWSLDTRRGPIILDFLFDD
jgi:hypothetical protein